MSITREQFIRGFYALKDAQVGRNTVEEAARDAGFEYFDMGCNPLAAELERQLVERCRAREDDNGPWPDDCDGEDDISIGLHWGDGFGSITDSEGNQLPILTTPEDIWAMWEETKTGPFREGTSA